LSVFINIIFVGHAWLESESIIYKYEYSLACPSYNVPPTQRQNNSKQWFYVVVLIDRVSLSVFLAADMSTAT